MFYMRMWIWMHKRMSITRQFSRWTCSFTWSGKWLIKQTRRQHTTYYGCNVWRSCSIRFRIDRIICHQAIENHWASFTDLWKKQIWCLNCWWCVEEVYQYQAERMMKSWLIVHKIWICVRYCSCASWSAYSITQDYWKWYLINNQTRLSSISMGEIPVIPVHGEQYSLGHNQY